MGTREFNAGRISVMDFNISYRVGGGGGGDGITPSSLLWKPGCWALAVWTSWPNEDYTYIYVHMWNFCETWPFLDFIFFLPNMHEKVSRFVNL